MAKLKPNQSQKGFTIAEVSIASAIFSVVLLIAIAVFFGIGRLFYKGVSVTQTQEVSQQVYQDVVGSFQSAGTVSLLQQGNGYYFYCIGNTRYTFNQYNQEVNLDVSPDHSAPQPPPAVGGNFGILKDSLPGNGSACAPPCSDTGMVVCNLPDVKFNNPTELLGQKMRVSKFDIEQAPGNNPNLYTLSLVIAYGDDDTMDLTDPTNPICNTGGSGSEFCSVNKLDTTVYRGLNF